MSMITHMHDILEALVDQILLKNSGIPFMLRYFFKVLYRECSAKYKEEYGEAKILSLMSDFLVQKWLINVCFIDIGVNGLSKDFYLEKNCKDNLKLLGEVMIIGNSLFR